MKELLFSEIIDKIGKLDLNGFDAVVGIGKGGVVPASLIAYKLNLPIFIMDINYRDENNVPKFDSPKLIKEFSVDKSIKSILLVDDVSATGKTLDLAKSNLPGYTVNTLVMAGKADIVVFPEINECVNWPWKKLSQDK